MATSARFCLRKTGTVSDRERVRPFSRDDEGSPRNCDRRQHRWDRVAALRIQMETGKCNACAGLVRAAPAAARPRDFLSLSVHDIERTSTERCMVETPGIGRISAACVAPIGIVQAHPGWLSEEGFESIFHAMPKEEQIVT